MKFSIVIPTYEYKGKGIVFLSKCLESIFQQTYCDYEIVIPDHSINIDIQRYVQNFNSSKIIYFRNEKGRGNSSVNMNEGIIRSRGEYIKILHANDWFCNVNCLEIIEKNLAETGKAWGGIGFDHYNQSTSKLERYTKPYILSEYQALVGCPSTSFFINDREDQNLYDENFIIINDADMHFRLQRKYGDPVLVDDCCVTVRVHDLQVTHFLTDNMKNEEIKNYKKKHNI